MDHITNDAKAEAAGTTDRGAQRAEGRASGSALRLEKRTHLNTGKYKVTLRDYGNGLAEIGWSFVGAAVTSKSGKGESEERKDHEIRAQRRARSKIRQLVLSAHADHMLTLTYRENVADFDRACNDLSKFIRQVKKKLPVWVYIAVAEQQGRGAWHWHMAVKGRQDVELLRTAWRHVVVEGNIDVSPPRSSGKEGTLALVRYLSKYLSKGFEQGDRELNRRRFRSSLGIVVPEVMLTLPPFRRADATAYAVDVLYKTAGSVGHVWNSPELAAGWACSWD